MFFTDIKQRPSCSNGGQIGCLTGMVVICITLSSCPTYACDQPPKPIRDLSVTRYYSDDAGTQVRAKKLQTNRQETQDLRQFTQRIARISDLAVSARLHKTNNPTVVCALIWLEAWAKKKALLGKMQTKQAEYHRKWSFTGLSLAYLKLRPVASQKQAQVIDAWLSDVATACLTFFSDPNRRRNNHWYWLGLGLTATSLATQDDKLWTYAQSIARDAAFDIQPDGTLPFELSRGVHALKYHDFSLMALIPMAELALRAKGEDWYRFNDGALHRLAEQTRNGFQNSKTFASQSGATQQMPSRVGVGWWHLYTQRHRSHWTKSTVLGDATVLGKTSHRWLGGDVKKLMRIFNTPTSTKR